MNLNIFPGAFCAFQSASRVSLYLRANNIFLYVCVLSIKASGRGLGETLPNSLLARGRKDLGKRAALPPLLLRIS